MGIEGGRGIKGRKGKWMGKEQRNGMIGTKGTEQTGGREGKKRRKTMNNIFFPPSFAYFGFAISSMVHSFFLIDLFHPLCPF